MKIKKEETKDAIMSYNKKVRHNFKKKHIDQYLDQYASFLSELLLKDQEAVHIYFEGWKAFRYMSGSLYSGNPYYSKRCSEKYIPDRYVEEVI